MISSGQRSSVCWSVLFVLRLCMRWDMLHVAFDILDLLLTPFVVWDTNQHFQGQSLYTSVSYHLYPHALIPHLIFPHLVTPHLVLPHLVPPHLVLPHLVPLQPMLPHPIPHSVLTRSNSTSCSPPSSSSPSCFPPSSTSPAYDSPSCMTSSASIQKSEDIVNTNPP